MNPVLWGLSGAVAFGTSDFVARLSGRAIGATSTLFGMFVVGAIALSLWIWIGQAPLVWVGDGVVWLIASSIGLTVGMLFLYAAFARGPVSVVAPLISSIPVFIILGSVILGIIPVWAQWIAMITTMIGVGIVARTGRAAAAEEPTGAGGLPLTIALTLASAVILAAALLAAREAAVTYGELQTLWINRLFGVVALALYIPVTRTELRLPVRWWPALLAMGILDTAAFLFLLIGSAGEGAPLAAIAVSPATIITILLAWVVLREPIPLRQWSGIIMVVGSVAILSYIS